ncbi:MAG: ABC transporter permease [Lentisphaeria bacterium]|nr:ABC transporter permease [Lentisphaeria bacterium]
MSILMIFRVALRAIWRNKVRSLLTALGIIVGIAAVIAVIAIGTGAGEQMKTSINSMGNNLVMIFPSSMRMGGASMGAGASNTLTAEDGEQIEKDLPNLVAGQTPMVRASAQVIYGENNWSTSISGVGTGFPVVRGWDVGEGSFFSEDDIQTGRRVLILGKTVVDNLFTNGENPIGKSIRVKNMSFKVIGVMERKGSNSMGQDQDDIVVMPYTTVKRTIQRSSFNNVNQLLVSLYDMDDLDEAKAEMTSLLRQRHRLGAHKEDDFNIRDMTEITEMMTSISSTITILLGAVASISLIVGGIGIMNIMLVSVTERTKEIGLRMAIGARPWDILMQFLLEAMTLACVGGLIGTVLGVVGAKAVGNIQNWPILITEGSVLISFAFSAFVGIFFGFYPAWRASQLNPIDCLRYE